MRAIAPDGTAYELTGPEGAPMVVLIHGLGLNRACWRWTIPALADGYRVLSYDLFGHGQSAPPPETPSLSLFQGNWPICWTIAARPPSPSPDFPSAG